MPCFFNGMEAVLSKNLILICLTDERWQRIVEGHPEMHSYRERVLSTVREPDFIGKGENSELKAVSAQSEDERVLVVVYKEINGDDGSIITAHMGRTKTRESLKKREIVWKRPNYTE